MKFFGLQSLVFVPYLINFVYLLLLILLSPWIVLAAIRKGKYREGYAAKLLGRVPWRAGDRRCIWLHAVSVGEVNLLRTILEELEQRHPDVECVVSTTTKTGYALAKGRYPHRAVFYCPLDFSWAVRRALKRIRPDLLVLAELELWPNLIRAAQERGTKVAVINARMGERSFRGYRRIRPLMARLLRRIDLVAAQDDHVAQRFLALGTDPGAVHVTGSVKYDGAETNRRNPVTDRFRAMAGIEPEDIVLLAGSTQVPEESLVLDTYRALVAEYPRLRLILVPRHPERFPEVVELLTRAGIPFARRTQLESNRAAGAARVLLVDVIGELAAWWGTADIAFVGGSLTDRGGQNMIEPAAYGAAVSFGPNTWNFHDIVTTMLAADAAVVIHNGNELTAFLRRCLNDRLYASQLGIRARSLVLAQQGATHRTMTLIETLLRDAQSARSASAKAA